MLATIKPPRCSSNRIARSKGVDDFCVVPELSTAIALADSGAANAIIGLSFFCGDAASIGLLTGGGEAAGESTFAFCLLPFAAARVSASHAIFCLFMRGLLRSRQ